MKIGFIAMSGVRAQDPELLKLGLTLPGFIERGKIIASLPSLGLLTLAGMTPKDFDIDYLEIADIRDVNGLPGDYDAVAISSLSAQINEAYELADRYRESDTIVLMGGLHVTALPNEALEHADCVVIGEGEPVWNELLSDLKMKRLKRVYDARACPFDFADSPMPRFDLLDPERYNRLTVQTSRGCPFDCEFCASSIRLQPKYRVKPVDKVIAEIRHIKEIWQNPFIEFADDNTFVNKRHGKELLRALIPENIRWFTETDISVARDDELLSLLRDSGCAQILIGLESASHSGLKGVERNSDWKAKQHDGYLSAVQKIQSYGISVNGCFVLGLDGSGLESFQEVADFVKESGVYDVQVTIQTPFPGTPLYERLKQSNRLIHEGEWERCTLFDVNYVPKLMSVNELETNFRNLVKNLYSKKATTERRDKFYRQLRQVVKREHANRRLYNEQTTVD